jgi:hypothetical protein
MPYGARVYKVMIASPADVEKERRIARDLIHEWNTINSEDRNIVLMPVVWDTHSSPSMEARAQEVINRQVLVGCDLLVAIFWTRIGTPTGEARSGTIEEIEKHLKTGKPTMIYFSYAPVRPDSVSEEQYSDLRDFRKDLMNRGLIESYESLAEFREKFARQLAQTVIRNFMVDRDSDLLASQSYIFPLSSPKVPSLSDDAKELLVAAASEGDGHILSVRTLAGLSIQTGDREFVVTGSTRSEARWQKALEELSDLDLIRDLGYKGEVFMLTADGFAVADTLELETD